MKLISLNIEGKKHLKEVCELLAKEGADTVCLMEVSKSDVLTIAGENYPFVVFAPNDVLGNIGGMEGAEPTGVAILSKEVMIDVEKDYFGEKPRNEIVPVGSGTHAPVLLTALIGDMRIGAVHFTWTKKGTVSLAQTKHLNTLLEKTAKDELVMCGDFNIPRGNASYKKLAKNFVDNMPAEIITTLDPVLHYANKEKSGRLKLVVDYVWSKPGYLVNNLRVVEGVSDHCAIVCEVNKI